MASDRRPILAITLGDPGGIGPEVVAKALLRPSLRRLSRFAIIAEAWTPRPAFLPRHFSPLSAAELDDFCRGLLSATKKRRHRGPSGASGRAAIESLLKAIPLAIQGQVDALVTAPISKEAVRMAGYLWPGHTELLAELTGVKHPVMTMVGGGLIVALVTTHVSIADLPRQITRSKVLRTIHTLNDGLRRYWGVKHPRIAVCGLNPHAGESGQFGDEEIKAIGPAARQARKAGVNCTLPLPADVVFYQARRKLYDGIVAMYHDQANIPVKMLGFENGVNVTLGLPIIRTSPDHGTAFDIAGKGIANPGSMIAAIKLAVRMTKRRSWDT